VQVPVTDVYGPCGNPYEITVDGVKYREHWPEHDMALVCSYGVRLLEPGQRFEESFTIPEKMSQLTHIGKHEITVTCRLAYASGGQPLNGSWLSRTIKARFNVIIGPPRRN